MQGRRADLAILRQQPQQNLCLIIAAAESAQRLERIAHRHGAADQFLFQPVMRQAQQVVLAYQVLQALVQVVLHGFGAAGARSPQAGELAHQHHGNQPAQKENLGELVHVTHMQGDPCQQQHDASAQPGQRAIAQGHDDGRQPGPVELRVHPERIFGIECHAHGHGNAGHEQGFQRHQPWAVAGCAQLAQRCTGKAGFALRSRRCGVVGSGGRCLVVSLHANAKA